MWLSDPRNFGGTDLLSTSGTGKVTREKKEVRSPQKARGRSDRSSLRPVDSPVSPVETKERLCRSKEPRTTLSEVGVTDTETGQREDSVGTIEKVPPSVYLRVSPGGSGHRIRTDGTGWGKLWSEGLRIESGRKGLPNCTCDTGVRQKGLPGR